MLVFWIAVFLGLLVLEMARQQAHESVVCSHQLRLYALRDDLRERAILGKVDSSGWVFRYLDSSITRTISQMRKLTLWRILAVAIVYRRDERIGRARMHLERELRKDTNTLLAEVYGQYIIEIMTFAIHRNLAARFAFLHLPAAVMGFQRRVSSVLEYTTEVPETSTLEELAPA